jgi:hypothetical protein
MARLDHTRSLSSWHVATSFVASALAAGSLVGLAACDPPNGDSTRSMGGPVADPTGVLQGSVLYAGPRPECLRTDDGSAYAIPGRVVLLLFRYDNPPPPSGSATGAENLLVLPGDQLFSLSDCMPSSPTPEERAPITRSVAFTWPSVRLGRTYQVRGFYDGDGDFNPFFSVRNLATAGDVGGGAFESASAAVPVYARITLPPATEVPQGFVLDGVAVTLGAVVQTERPLFQISPETLALSSEATIPPTSDALAREEGLFQLTRMRVSLVDGPDATDARGNTYGDALTAAGLGFDFRAVRHGMPILNLDADSNGVADLHPILGSSGVPWYTPAPLLRRAKSPVEARAGIPDVLLIGSIRPTVPIGARQGFVPRSTLSSADVIVPPVAVVITNPALPATCRVPFIPPGNVAELYEGGPVDCQELPTGNYDVNLLSGAAGGRVVDVFAECMADCVAGGTPEATCAPGCRTEASLRSDTGYVYDRASFSSQVWSIPNELGCPDTAYRPTAVNQLDLPRSDGTLPSCEESGLLLVDQGRAGAFAVVDPNGDNAPDPTSTADGHGVAACQTALRTTGPMAGMPGPVTYTAPSDACCAPIRPLCGLPLCPLRDASTEGYPEASRSLGSAGGSMRRTREMRVEGEDYRVRADGSIEPLCVPFLMPVGCCR